MIRKILAVGVILLIAGAILFIVGAAVVSANAVKYDVLGYVISGSASRVAAGRAFEALGFIALVFGLILTVIAMATRSSPKMPARASQPLAASASAVQSQAPASMAPSATSVTSKYCIHCGASIASNATFCSVCGKKQ